MLSKLILILSINAIIICNAFISYPSKLILEKRSFSRLYVAELSQLITNDNIVIVEIVKAVASLGTIIAFTSITQSSTDKRIADLISTSDKRLSDHISSSDKRLSDHISSSDKRLSDHINAREKRTNDHISSSDKRFTDLLTSMKEKNVFEAELLKERFNITNNRITKIVEDVEKIKEK